MSNFKILEETENSPTERYGHSAVIVGSNLYLFGGLHKSTFYNEMRIYDLETNIWEEKPLSDDKIQGRHFHTCVQHEEKLYMFGGKSNGYLNDLIVFDTKDGSLRLIEDATGEKPTKRYAHSACCVNGIMYIFGGYDVNGFDRNDLFTYDISKNEWARFVTKVPRRYYHNSVVLKNEWILFHGNSKRGGSLRDVWSIDLESKEVVEVKVSNSKMFKKVKRNYGQSSFVVNDKVYVYDGQHTESFDDCKGIFQMVVTKRRKDGRATKVNWKRANFPAEEDTASAFGSVTVHNEMLYFFGGQKVEVKKPLKVEKKKGRKKRVKTNIHDIPDDVVKYLLSYLTVNDLCKVSEASKTWNFSTFSTDNRYWKSHYEFVRDGLVPEKKLEGKLLKIDNYKMRLLGLVKGCKFDPRRLIAFLKKFGLEGEDKVFDKHWINPFFSPLKMRKELYNDRYRSKGNSSAGYYDTMNSTWSCLEHFKTVVIGDGAVGKTCMLISYANNSFPDDYVPTVFDNYNATVMFGKGNPKSHGVQMGLWDTAGEEDYDRLRPLSYPETNCFILCFSLVDPTSLENCFTKWLPEVREHCPGIPVVLVGTKKDLVKDDQIIQELKERDEEPVSHEYVLKRLREAHDVMFFVQNSAKTQEGLKHTFELIIAGCIIGCYDYGLFVGGTGPSEKKCVVQ